MRVRAPGVASTDLRVPARLRSSTHELPRHATRDGRRDPRALLGSSPPPPSRRDAYTPTEAWLRGRQRGEPLAVSALWRSRRQRVARAKRPPRLYSLGQMARVGAHSTRHARSPRCAWGPSPRARVATCGLSRCREPGPARRHGLRHHAQTRSGSPPARQLVTCSFPGFGEEPKKNALAGRGVR